MSETDILLFALMFFSVLIPFALYRLKSLRKQGIRQMQEKLSTETILLMDEKSIFYGQKSRGPIHARGLGGICAITDQAIYFKTFPYGKWSDFAISIPILKIHSIDKTSNFLSMSSNVIGGLVVVQFINSNNEEDEISWRFKQNDDTIQLLNNQITKQ